MRQFLTKLEQASRLDGLSDRLQRVVLSVLRPQRVRDVLHGVWLGHPLHPALVQVPVGAWTSAAVLDLLPSHRRAATTLIAVGNASAVPAVLAGVNDWSQLSQEQRRVGLVHALSNAVGLALYTGSLAARLGGREMRGRTLAYLGLTAVTAGAYLGGHLAYKQGAGVNEGAPELHRMSGGWHPIGDLASLPEAALLNRLIDDVKVLIYRTGNDITVMLERCPHQSGPLSEGQLTHLDGRACVVCPWHGSTFELSNGETVHGPAATDQQLLRTRVVGGVLEAQLP